MQKIREKLFYDDRHFSKDECQIIICEKETLYFKNINGRICLFGIFGVIFGTTWACIMFFVIWNLLKIIFVSGFSIKHCVVLCILLFFEIIAFFLIYSFQLILFGEYGWITPTHFILKKGLIKIVKRRVNSAKIKISFWFAGDKGGPGCCSKEAYGIVLTVCNSNSEFVLSRIGISDVRSIATGTVKSFYTWISTNQSYIPIELDELSFKYGKISFKNRLFSFYIETPVWSPKFLRGKKR